MCPSKRTLRSHGYGPELPSHRRADHHRHGAGGGDAEGGHHGHRGRGRTGERVVQLPVACRRRDNRYRDYGRHGPDLHPIRRRCRQVHQGQGELRRRCGQRGNADRSVYRHDSDMVVDPDGGRGDFGNPQNIRLLSLGNGRDALHRHLHPGRGDLPRPGPRSPI